jgi:hypothetical protein
MFFSVWDSRKAGCLTLNLDPKVGTTCGSRWFN